MIRMMYFVYEAESYYFVYKQIRQAIKRKPYILLKQPTTIQSLNGHLNNAETTRNQTIQTISIDIIS